MLLASGKGVEIGANKTSRGLPDPDRLQAFQTTVWTHYGSEARDLPWRRTHDPYLIIVSEFMLQQTQVSRVIAKYGEFTQAFPDVETLAAAPLEEVLRIWQGLGYNRRALALKRLAEQVMAEHGGRIPRDPDALRRLPGIGQATAGAVAAFAFGDAHAFLETNIRAVYLHHFFADRQGVADADLLPLVEATLDRDDPRNWYYALMDYGSALKRLVENPGRRSRHHSRQSPFEGSRRQLRAKALRAILTRPGQTPARLAEEVGARTDDLVPLLDALTKEGFLREEDGRFFPAS